MVLFMESSSSLNGGSITEMTENDLELSLRSDAGGEGYQNWSRHLLRRLLLKVTRAIEMLPDSRQDFSRPVAERIALSTGSDRRSGGGLVRRHRAGPCGQLGDDLFM